MAHLYSEEFHEFLETYGELLDRVEDARDALEVVQEEVSSRLDDLSEELEETMNLLQALEKQVWQFRSRTEAGETVIKEQKQIDQEDILSIIPDQADTEDPFAEIWRS